MSVFQLINDDEKIYKGKHFFLIYDRFPVSPGHMLIISNILKLDFFNLDADEQLELNHMILVAKSIIEDEFTPDGYNIGMNCGESAGQTVMHFHCHIIPRYHGDMLDPRGGVRHCISGKGYY